MCSDRDARALQILGRAHGWTTSQQPPPGQERGKRPVKIELKIDRQGRQSKMTGCGQPFNQLHPPPVRPSIHPFTPKPSRRFCASLWPASQPASHRHSAKKRGDTATADAMPSRPVLWAPFYKGRHYYRTYVTGRSILRDHMSLAATSVDGPSLLGPVST